MNITRAQEILKHQFGFDSFRMNQQAAIETVLAGKDTLVLMPTGGGNSAGEAALFLAQEGAFATLATFRKDWEETDPKQGCIKHWVKEPLEQQLEKNCLDVFFLKRVVEIREKDIVLEEENGAIEILPNDVVFILIGSDADLTMLERLGVEMKDSKYGRVPVYDEETFETNVAGVYVVGHFTEARHIAGAIEVPKKIIPKIASKFENRKSV